MGMRGTKALSVLSSSSWSWAATASRGQQPPANAPHSRNLGWLLGLTKDSLFLGRGLKELEQLLCVACLCRRKTSVQVLPGQSPALSTASTGGALPVSGSCPWWRKVAACAKALSSGLSRRQRKRKKSGQRDCWLS